ncbi:MAG: protein kinase [Ghiorsea sp.]
MTRFLGYFWVGLLVLITLVIFSLRYNQYTPITPMDAFIYKQTVNLLPQTLHQTKQVVVIGISEKNLLENNAPLTHKEALLQLLRKLGETKPKSVSIIQPPEHLGFQSELGLVQELKTSMQSVELPPQEQQVMESLLADMHEHLNIDQRLTETIKSLNHVFLPFKAGSEIAQLPKFVKTFDIQDKKQARDTLENISNYFVENQSRILKHSQNLFPHPAYADAAFGVGYLSDDLNDNAVQTASLLQPYQDGMLVSLPLMLVAHAQGVAIRDLHLDENNTLTIGEAQIQLGNQYQVFPRHYDQVGNELAFQVYDFEQLMSGKVDAENLTDKIVLIDVLAAQNDDTSEAGYLMSRDTEMVAQTVSSLLNQASYSHTNAMLWLEVLMFMFVTAFVLFIMPRLSFTSASFISLLLLLSMLGLEMFLLLREQLWLNGAASILLLLAGYAVLIVRHIFSKQQAVFASDIYQANRQLGLLLQNQGQLEQAFECYQKLSSQDDDLGLMYNLALDFERKRKFNNAAAAFHYILQYQHAFKDVTARLLQAQQMEQTITLGTGHFHNLGSLLVEGKGEKPMLGRFVIEKELGRGAMGAVYLGRDPKIDRVVAVKTLALAQEFDSTEIKEVEQRFFQEASAAGRLNHPNIVTIYDAAEEHDLAYIAMEYISGDSLDAFVQKDRLLPTDLVLKIIAKIADGLEYAGQQGIVHRDIKPANIMFNEAKNIVKITDFGIARISSSGKTKTGMILGTPSFMSPEQMSGAHVDLRSDIFSLGVTMYVLLTGEKPFPGDSLASISYKIVNDKHPDITQIRQGLPKPVKTILDKALQKNPDKRYQSGIVMKRAIIRCLKAMEDGGSVVAK